MHTDNVSSETFNVPLSQTWFVLLVTSYHNFLINAIEYFFIRESGKLKLFNKNLIFDDESMIK